MYKAYMCIGLHEFKKCSSTWAHYVVAFDKVNQRTHAERCSTFDVLVQTILLGVQIDNSFQHVTHDWNVVFPGQTPPLTVAANHSQQVVT